MHSRKPSQTRDVGNEIGEESPIRQHRTTHRSEPLDLKETSVSEQTAQAEFPFSCIWIDASRDMLPSVGFGSQAPADCMRRLRMSVGLSWIKSYVYCAGHLHI